MLEDVKITSEHVISVGQRKKGNLSFFLRLRSKYFRLPYKGRSSTLVLPLKAHKESFCGTRDNTLSIWRKRRSPLVYSHLSNRTIPLMKQVVKNNSKTQKSIIDNMTIMSIMSFQIVFLFCNAFPW